MRYCASFSRGGGYHVYIRRNSIPCRQQARQLLLHISPAISHTSIFQQLELATNAGRNVKKNPQEYCILFTVFVILMDSWVLIEYD